jgi:hypothetical protein
VPSNASLERVITTSKMAALQSRRGSGSSLANLRGSLMAADNPRRGSAVGQYVLILHVWWHFLLPGNYGLPVPPDSVKFGGSSHFQPSDSRPGSGNNSGRNSPVHLPSQALQEDNQVIFTHEALLMKLFNDWTPA